MRLPSLATPVTRRAVAVTGVSTVLKQDGEAPIRGEGKRKGKKYCGGEGGECRASKTPDHMQIRGTDATRNVRAGIIPDRFFCRTRDLNAG